MELNLSTALERSYYYYYYYYLFFVQGERYWRYSGWPGTRQLDAGYPRLIGDGFPGVPSDLDAAFVWGKRRHIYFIKGTLRGPIFQTS